MSRPVCVSFESRWLEGYVRPRCQRQIGGLKIVPRAGKGLIATAALVAVALAVRGNGSGGSECP